ncbi:LPS translocon maturation chaperone LptM [Roseateles subflavus]
MTDKLAGMKINPGGSLVPHGADSMRTARKAMPSMRSRGRLGAAARLGALALCSLAALSACGQKGPLTLPPAKPAAMAPASTPVPAPASAASSTHR